MPVFNRLDAKVICSFLILNLRNNFLPILIPSSTCCLCLKSVILKISYKLLSIIDGVIPSITCTGHDVSNTLTSLILILDLPIASTCCLCFLVKVVLGV